MNRNDATEAARLYGMIEGVDRTLEHVRARSQTHQINVEVWATTGIGNGPLKIALRDDEIACEGVVTILQDTLLRRRRAFCVHLTELGFEPPQEAKP